MADLTPTTQGALPSSRPDGKPHRPFSVLKWRTVGEGKREIAVVEIHWLDAVGVATSQWEDESQITGAPAESLAVGYLISETSSTYTVMSVVNAHHYAHGITIPKGCVSKVVRLA